MENFVYGTVLKKIRKELKLSQKDVSENICSQAMLSRIENNDVIPNVIIMQQLCSRLNKSVDEVLSHNDSSVNRKNAQAQEVLDLISYYHSTEQYSLLNNLMTTNHFLESFTTDTQLQAFHYYKACLLAFYDPQSEHAFSLLEKSLNYTYKKNNKPYLTDMELMIMCELATYHLNNDNLAKGLLYINQISTSFEEKKHDLTRHELVRSLYNICVALIHQGQIELAQKLIECGINWAKEKQIYYYLDQLFLLKGVIMQENYKINEAIDLIKTANQVRMLASSQ
ncbi:helix-turn-helix domain-containing protein [Vagococcus zengguangii]|uniref:Helix-turn-helix transcriptional regulator n=1 Tax=Vagococcus zengguangii TaxID=2571750 RepID=A0A4D7CNM5_9ENTE|nr:helix-turn-helix transcriptional regulator [Vagococcus zengguangii]QCI85669.1 helix-turn-helix transcriptional regulator [Vagococcus zengguangii]